MTVKFKAKNGNIWIKATFIKDLGEKFLIECMGRHYEVDPEQVIFS
jgi:hypothetical protein